MCKSLLQSGKLASMDQAALGTTLAKLLRDIKTLEPLTEHHVVTEWTFEKRGDLVATFNALMLPRGYVYVDDSWTCHVVVIRTDNRELGFKFVNSSITSIADVVWDFNAVTGTWNVLKDRHGTFWSLCPIKCGGILTRKVKQ
jgi:hypothetical protein